jgi:dienelactone hydrolase
MRFPNAAARIVGAPGPRHRTMSLLANGLPETGNDAPPAGAGPAAPGVVGRFRFADDRGEPAKPLTVWYYQPLRLPVDAPIVFVMHGVKRDADHYRDTWMRAAERMGFVLICPRFARADYPRGAYQLGNLVNDAGEPLPQNTWTFNAIERLFDFVKDATGNASERYYIYGHSAGGQFVHRLALFVPEARYAAAVTANAGWYTMPTFDGDEFPYGLEDSMITPDELKRAFGRRLVVLLGERDTNAGDPHLRRTSAARRQGKNRFERGHAFYATAKTEAARLGVELNWVLHTVPEAAHLQQQMMPAAAVALFANGEQG